MFISRGSSRSPVKEFKNSCFDVSFRKLQALQAQELDVWGLEVVEILNRIVLLSEIQRQVICFAISDDIFICGF